MKWLSTKCKKLIERVKTTFYETDLEEKIGINFYKLFYFITKFVVDFLLLCMV